MGTQATGGGSVTSFYNAPQASDDVYDYDEEELLADSNLYNQGTRTLFLDVMSDDLGGKAKSLFSITDDSGALTDLLQSNVSTGWEQTAEGNWIRINAGKIEFRVGDGTVGDPSAVIDVNSLGGDDVIEDTFLYSIRMANGTISYATVSVTIQGVNDTAVITEQDGADHAVIEAGGLANATPGDPDAGGNLDVTDVDTGEDHFEAAEAADLQGDYGNFTFDAATGEWTYILDNTLDATQALNEGDAATDTLTVYSHDGTSHVITVNITGTNDAAVITEQAGADHDATEAGGVDNATPGDPDAGGNLDVTDVDEGEGHFEAALAASLVGTYGNFTFDETSGAWTYTLDNSLEATQALIQDEATSDTLTVYSHDGTSHVITVNITGTNDAAVITEAEDADLEVIEAGGVANAVAGDPDAEGDLNVTDVDAGQDSFQAPAAGDLIGDYGEFSFDEATGEWSYELDNDLETTQALDQGDEVTDTLTILSADGTAHAIVVNITGANDAPTAANDTDAVDEDGNTSGSVAGNDDDVDANATLTYALVNAAPTGLTFNNDGSWTFDASSYDSLSEDEPLELVIPYTVTDEFGASASANLTITVTGVNDAAEIGGTLSGNITEDEVPNTVSGTATASDVDNTPNTFLAGAGGTTYGSFTVSSSGLWVYTLNNSLSAVQDLNAGDPFLTDTFEIQSADGTSQTVTIHIFGADEGGGTFTEPTKYDGLDAVNDHDGDSGTGSSSNPLLPGATEGEDTLDGRTTQSGADTINALGGNDTVNAGDGGDNVYGGSGNDTIFGGDGNDLIFGQAGNDLLYGQDNNDTIYGGSGNDYIDGGNVTDTLLNGGSGDDTILGGVGADTIIGGYGEDLLTGGGDNDIFRYLDKFDTNDTITDFRAPLMGNDQLDLSGIDADDLLGGNQDFEWGGDNGPIANGLWFEVSGGNTTLYGDTNGDLTNAEFMITLNNFTGFSDLAPTPDMLNGLVP